MANNAELECERVENERIARELAHQIKMDKIYSKIMELKNARIITVIPPKYNRRLMYGECVTQTDFFAACVDGNFDMVQDMLKISSINPNIGFFEAVLFNRIDIVVLLLADTRTFAPMDGNRALKHAITSDHAEMVKLLLKKFAQNAYYFFNFHLNK